MKRKTVKIVNKLGLHARAAAKFVQVASGFQAEINVYSGHREVSGKSIMGIMMLAAEPGSLITIVVEGSDEQDAFNALKDLIANKFYEEEN